MLSPAMSATIRPFLRRFGLRLLPRGAADEAGLAAVEFSLILPILVVLWIGGVEVTGALSVDRRLNNFVSSMGDLVARMKTVSYAQVNDIFDLSEAALFPYDDTGMAMRITAVDINGAGDAKVAWSRARGGMTAYNKDTTVNSSVPEALRGIANAGTQIIMSEGSYDYTPTVGYVISGTIGLDDRMFFVPRVAALVKICPTADPDSCVASI
jgi:Flp pilus assembly protein TadG